jgi:hypothetical protein
LSKMTVSTCAPRSRASPPAGASKVRGRAFVLLLALTCSFGCFCWLLVFVVHCPCIAASSPANENSQANERRPMHSTPRALASSAATNSTKPAPERPRTFYQDAKGGAHPRPYHHRRRRGQPQRAGAGYHQDGDAKQQGKQEVAVALRFCKNKVRAPVWKSFWTGGDPVGSCAALSRRAPPQSEAPLQFIAAALAGHQ